MNDKHFLPDYSTMAIDGRVCSVAGCGRVHQALGFCANHYYRLRTHGDPLLGRRRASPGEPQQWIRDHAGHQGNDCLEWPFGKAANGYAEVLINGRKMVASRAMCIEAHGAPSSESLEAAHSCGRGHHACMNPRHLSWKTGAENQADRHIHGTDCAGVKNPAAKLNVRDIRQIRRLLDQGRTQTSVAAQFGISQTHVWSIKAGKNWSHIL